MNDYKLNAFENCVELSSARRLPFEPKGDLKEMRQALRSELKKLSLNPEQILVAEYHSHDRSFVDVENVLYYNVGQGAFSALAKHGVVFERFFDGPEDEIFRHFSRYSVASNNWRSSYWNVKKSLATIPCLKIPSLKGEFKPHDIWHHIKNSKVVLKNKSLIENGKDLQDFYTVDIEIIKPRNTLINLTNPMKVLFDGIICAFHYHEGSLDNSILGYLSDKLAIPSSMIEDNLRDSPNAVLGKRNLIHKFGSGIQWNPADDYCVLGKILITGEHDLPEWHLKIEVHSVEN